MRHKTERGENRMPSIALLTRASCGNNSDNVIA